MIKAEDVFDKLLECQHDTIMANKQLTRFMIGDYAFAVIKNSTTRYMNCETLIGYPLEVGETMSCNLIVGLDRFNDVLFKIEVQK